MRSFIFVVTFLVFLLLSFQFAHQTETDFSLTLKDAKQCGISYQNNIRETGKYNHVFWENVYHGAGVAVGDLNNDGLPDVFFAGNQVKDELYFNKGNFQFENKTQNLSAPSNHYWSNGVTMADVNADGWLDIYVCKSGASLNPNDRKNLLFINNANPDASGGITFSERAIEFGLADEGYSIQTVFFDMDNDGDLDAYVANQPPSTVQEKRQNILYNTSCDAFSDNLYENRDGQFVKTTSEATVSNCAYALGVVAADINQDGWTDLYVSNDYVVADHLYLNQKNGKFKDVSNEYFGHQSLYAMGADVADFNNDGLLDVFTADMSAADHYRNKANMPSMNRQRFHEIVNSGNGHQYMFNALQVNNGNGSFSEIAQMAGVANTDWSWSALFADIDNDTQKDLLITNGIKRDVRFVDGLNKLTKSLEDGTIKLSEILANTPSQPLKNFAFQNKNNLKFKDVSEDWGFALESFSAGMALGDLDNDGDLDIIVNNVDQPPFIFQNNSKNNFLVVQLNGIDKNTLALGAKATLKVGNTTQTIELTATRGYLSSSEPKMFFGIKDNKIIDSLTITLPNAKPVELAKIGANQFLKIDFNKSAYIQDAPSSSNSLFKETKFITFQHKEIPFNPFGKEVLLPHKLSQLGPAIAVGDINTDGLDDFFIGGAKGQAAKLWVQKKDGTYSSHDEFSWSADNAYEDTDALIFDANNDGKPDIYVASGSNEFAENALELQDRLYINLGSTFIRKDDALPSMPITTAAVKATDFDNDGDMDLFVGGLMKQHNYPTAAPSFLLENEGGKFKDVTSQKAPELRESGMVRDAVWTDFDSDGDEDLILVGEWSKIRLFENKGGEFIPNENRLLNTRGMWHSIEAFDFDGDGDDDYLVGNLGLNNKFKKGGENGFHLFCADFDENGVNDIVLSKEKNGKLLPVRGRECSSEQMPFIADKFPTFHEFASADLQDIYTAEKLESADHFEIDLMESIYLINEGNGNFSITPLPNSAQISVITDFVSGDFDQDGIADAIAIGNKYETEVETARYDAGIGLFLRGKSSGGFEAVSASESGLYLNGNMRKAALINEKHNPVLVVGMNDAALEFRQVTKINHRQ